MEIESSLRAGGMLQLFTLDPSLAAGLIVILIICSCILWWHYTHKRKPFPKEVLLLSGERREKVERQLEDLLQQIRVRSDRGEPDDAAMLETAATMFYQIEEIGYALVALRDAHTAREAQGLPANPEMLSLKASCHYCLHEFMKAETCFKAALDACNQQRLPVSPVLYRDYAVNQGELGFWHQELELYDLADQATIAQGYALYYGIAMNKAVVLRQQGQIPEALQHYREAERRRSRAHLPAEPDIANNRGALLCAIGQYRAALRQFDKAQRQARPGYRNGPSLAYNRASALEGLARYDEALLGYAKADELCSDLDQPYLVETAVNRARINFDKEFVVEALHWMQTAQQRADYLEEPLDLDALNLYGVVLRHSELYEQALAKYDLIEQYHKVHNTDPGPVLPFNRGLVYADLGRWETAHQLMLEAQAKLAGSSAKLPYLPQLLDDITYEMQREGQKQMGTSQVP